MRSADLIVARLVVERGWVSADAVKTVLDELGRSGRVDASLAAVLRERGLLDEAKHRALSGEEPRHVRVVERYSDIRKADSVIGEALVRQGLVEERSLEEGFAVQVIERNAGKVRRLADILIERGMLKAATLIGLLQKMGVESLTCAACTSAQRVNELTGSDPLSCVICGGPLVDAATLAAIRRDLPAMPEEALIASQLPERDFGKFILVQHVGSGGMGTVWKCWDRELGRWVALKLLRRSQDPDKQDEDLRRFLREAALVARLRHPNIVTVYESGEVRQHNVIVMEFVDGKPLNHLRLPQRRALEVVRDAARAVQYAHEQGVVHRDLKPSNVMVSAKGQTFVMDFGLARSVTGPSTLTQSGFVVGTPMYMAPEQASAIRDRNEKLCDVYSLGATLYDLLTGRPPFEGEQAWDVVADVIHADPVPPRRRNPEVSQDAETICVKAMAKQSSARYGSAATLADDIDRALKGEPILARPVPWTERAWRAIKKHRAAAIACVVIVAAIAGASTVVAASLARARRELAAEADRLAVDAARAGSDYRSLRAERIATARRIDELTDATDGTERRGLEARLREIDETMPRGYATVLGKCDAATRLVPAHLGARRALGELAWERFLLAEERAEGDIATPAAMVRAYAPEYAAQIDAPARFAISSSPSGARVEYAPYVLGEDGRLVPGASGSVGFTPLDLVDVPAGSGAFVLKLEGRRDTVVPVLGLRSGRRGLRVNLFTNAQIGERYVHVSAGPCALGGDTSAQRPQPRREVEVADFFISRDEVTWEEYLEFLNDIESSEAASHEPRRVNGSPRLARNAERRWVAPLELKRQPIASILWPDAAAYCVWRSKQEGRTIRLPKPAEWEKAARGPDGRVFPWGSVFDWTFTFGAGSAPEQPQEPRTVGSTPFDESPYGVRDMAGNVMEWIDEAMPGLQIWGVRGGSFALDTPAGFRSTNRKRSSPARQQNMGFRVVAEPLQ